MSDTAGRGTARPASLECSMASASLLALLRVRRCSRSGERRSRNPMSSQGQPRWWYDKGWLDSWRLFLFGPTLSADKSFRPAEIQSGSNRPLWLRISLPRVRTFSYPVGSFPLVCFRRFWRGQRRTILLFDQIFPYISSSCARSAF